MKEATQTQLNTPPPEVTAKECIVDVRYAAT